MQLPVLDTFTVPVAACVKGLTLWLSALFVMLILAGIVATKCATVGQRVNTYSGIVDCVLCCFLTVSLLVICKRRIRQ